MSSLMEQARSAVRRPVPIAPRPPLTIVPKLAARTPRIPFVFLVVLLLSTGMIGLLVLNTTLQRGAYEVTTLQNQVGSLTVEQQKLERTVSNLGQPDRVARQAIRLGMVQNLSPAFLDLSSGRVLGNPTPGLSGDAFDLGDPPSAKQLASRSQSERDDVLADSRRRDLAEQERQRLERQRLERRLERQRERRRDARADDAGRRGDPQRTQRVDRR